MRREGYELQIGQPQVIFKEIDGVKCEPMEELTIDLPEIVAGKAIETVSQRKGEMTNMEPKADRMILKFMIPARGIIGLRNYLLNVTAGEAIVKHRFKRKNKIENDIETIKSLVNDLKEDEILNLIFSDLDFASTKLPTPTNLGTADYGRIANTAALAFKARVALFEGTRAKFHKYGDSKKYLTIAAAASKAVIDSKQHTLYSGAYFNIFQYEGEGRANRENILVKQYGVSLTDRVTSHQYCRGILENGNKSPTKALVDSYLMKDGLPISKSPLYKAPVLSTDVFTNRDTRLSDDVLKAGDSYIFTNPVFRVSSLVFAKTGFTFRKYWNIVDWNNQASFIDRNLIRYAEVLLIYAEAQFELGESISDSDLNLTINELRKRGGVAPLSNNFIQANGLSLRDEIRRERRVELAQEGFRYWDLIRWKTAEIELPKPVLGNFFFKEFGTTVKVNLTSDNYIVTQAASFRKFDPSKDYLWPLPINEIALNPSMKQNPGW
jgi:hypothetical protein